MGSNCHGKTGADVEVHLPLGSVVTDAESGERLADLVTAGETRAARQGRQRRLGQPALRDADAPGAALRQAGPARRRAPPRDRAQAARRRRDHRLSQRRQVHAHLGDLGREAEDRRLPVHDARAAPRRRAVQPRPPHARRGRHPRAHRGRARGRRASASGFSSTSSAAGCSATSSTPPRRGTPSPTSRRSSGSSRSSRRKSRGGRASSSPPSATPFRTRSASPRSARPHERRGLPFLEISAATGAGLKELVGHLFHDVRPAAPEANPGEAVDSPSMRIGVFGGTFDPVHNGHVLPVEAAATKFQLRPGPLRPGPALAAQGRRAHRRPPPGRDAGPGDRGPARLVDRPRGARPAAARPSRSTRCARSRRGTRTTSSGC